MGYYRDKNVSPGLMPIVIALSVVAIIGFAFCLYFNSQVQKEADQDAASGLQPATAASPAAVTPAVNKAVNPVNKAIHSRV
jgi:hypothetical protein